jgi:hypothetical protein
MATWSSAGDRSSRIALPLRRAPPALARSRRNTRSGRSFRRLSIPQARSGTADDVIVLDHDRNGLDDFLVLNGNGFVGPVQLIAAYRRR